MAEWERVSRFCRYLETVTKELDDKVHTTQSEVMKLQNILDTISPTPVSEPREDVRVVRAQANRRVFRGFDHKVTPQTAATSGDPYGDFCLFLEQYKQMPKFDRVHIADRFAKRILDFSRTTAAHMYVRLPPCMRRLTCELDKILDYDLSQPNLKFRAQYTTEKGQHVLKAFDKAIREFGLSRRTEVFANEQIGAEPQKRNGRPRENADQFETLANFTPKQLNALYAMRGQARRSLMASAVKEKAETCFMSFLKDCGISEDEREQVNVLRAAKRAFLILSYDPRSYAVVQGR
jgi:hypothetical protein